MLQPSELEGLLREHPEIRLLDVRTAAEHETAHIPGTYNVPLDTLPEHAAEIQASVTEPIVLICQSGQRARKAEDALGRAGLSRLHVLDGGVNGWVQAGLPVRRGRHKVSLERQVRMAAGVFAAAGGVLALLADPAFALIPALVGGGLFVAGATDTCAMGLLLGRLPYNRSASCDIDAVVRAMKGEPQW